MVLPLAALEPELLKVTARGAGPAATEEEMIAVGGEVLTGAVTVITRVATLV